MAGDQRNQALELRTHRSIGHARSMLQPQALAINNRPDKPAATSSQLVSIPSSRGGDDREGDVAANHVYLAMGEVNRRR